MPSARHYSLSRFPFLSFWAGVILIVAALALIGSKQGGPPPEPAYQGMTLRKWIRAEPHMPVTSHEDIMTYRRTALRAMGQPAIDYLHWMILHPGKTLDQHMTSVDRLRARLPPSLRKLLPSPPPPGCENFMNVVFSLQLIGPRARAAAPDLVRLWESGGNPEYARYNGFPLTLAELGDASPKNIAALHRHFSSRDDLHRSLCAFAAWRLNPNDTEAIALIRHSLSYSDRNRYNRGALLDSLGKLGTNAIAFLPEIRAFIAEGPTPDSARVAWRIVNDAEPSRQLFDKLAKRVSKPWTDAQDINYFAATALDLAEVPGMPEFTIPYLKKLSLHKDASAASFASNIMVRMEQRIRDGTELPMAR